MKYLERVALALLLLTWCGCAHPRPQRDTPQFRGCRLACEREGQKPAALIEDEESVACLCKKPPEPGT